MIFPPTAGVRRSEAGEASRQIILRRPGRVHVKAIYTDGPWTATGIDTPAPAADGPWPTPDPGFRIRVDGRTFASFDDAFGDRWQTAEFDLDIRGD